MKLLRNISPALVSVIVALCIGGLLIAVSDPQVRPMWSYLFSRPQDAISNSALVVRDAYFAMFSGSVVNPSAVSDWLTGSTSLATVLGPLATTLAYATPVILGGLAVGLALRAGLFNIGAEGQVIVGAAFAAFVGFAFSLPPVIHVLVAITAGAIGGALWGMIPGVLKVTTGAHEVITTIMLNYIAGFGLLMLLVTTVFQREGRNDPVSKPVLEEARLLKIIEPLPVTWGFIVALVAVIAVAFLLDRTPQGFQIRAVGMNRDAARAAGIPVSLVLVFTFAGAGALAGMAGSGLVLGPIGSLNPAIAVGVGFNAITAAFLGKGRPWPTMAAALLVGALQAGGVSMQASTATVVDVVLVIQALVLLFVAGPVLVRKLLPKDVMQSTGPVLQRGWNG